MKLGRVGNIKKTIYEILILLRVSEVIIQICVYDTLINQKTHTKTITFFTDLSDHLSLLVIYLGKLEIIVFLMI